ncbi:transporter substrate-binding domain-containing protein [uncultured Nitratireductor sp.]|uniref:transporter substrate-binding domain-containing protein n=1 Tax=uncultured Nitratireductor sp. TaxID=520953 RepID=UPI002600EFF4|nr:transporter substrate-binding domain-containing protein [uncultured Nitratireductor sp.]
MQQICTVAVRSLFERPKRFAAMLVLCAAALLGGLVGFAPQLRAQEAADAQNLPLDVGVYVNAPFVEKEENGDYTGLAVELWEGLAESLGREYRFIEFESVHDLMGAAASSDIDVAVSNLTINEPRAQRVDFTQPWYDGGDRIMIRTEQGQGFANLIAGLSDAGFLKAYAWIAAVIVIATVLLTLFDRRFDNSFPTRWRDGIAESFYAVMSVATSGKPPSRKNLFGWVGRIWQGLWLVCGIAVLAYVTSTVTSVMTTLSLTSQITSLDDLSNKPVAVMTGTVQEDFVRGEGLQARSYPGLGDAVQGLLNGDVDAIVHDAPVLEYYAHTHPDQAVEVVGRLFEKDKYGFALPRRSPLTRPLTLEILAAIDADTVDELQTKYFGAGQQ